MDAAERGDGQEEGEIVAPAPVVDKKTQRLQARRAAAQAAADELRVTASSQSCRVSPISQYHIAVVSTSTLNSKHPVLTGLCICIAINCVLLNVDFCKICMVKLLCMMKLFAFASAN